MPYKNKEKVRQYQKKWVRQRRGSTENVQPEDAHPPGWVYGVWSKKWLPPIDLSGLSGPQLQALKNMVRYWNEDGSQPDVRVDNDKLSSLKGMGYC